MGIENVIHKEGQAEIKIWAKSLDPEGLRQLVNLSKLAPVAALRAMPDAHAGAAATVGAVIALRGALIPSALGGDLGCGMSALKTSLKAEDLPESLRKLRLDWERQIPVGEEKREWSKLKGGWIERKARKMESRWKELLKETPALSKMLRRADTAWLEQMGTLGGGNHFIELCLDQQGSVWVMLHSGSRGVGGAIGRHFIERARKEAGRAGQSLPDQELAWLEEGSPLFESYVEAMNWATDWAALNRETMMHQALESLKGFAGGFKIEGNVIDCHHNYATKESWRGESLWVMRKGAIRAGAGEQGIIPGSMGAASYIVEGLGSEESICSCSHGAGRAMSRSKAKLAFKEEDIVRQLAGVECKKDLSVIDELPACYKDIDEVMEQQRDLVRPTARLKQILCVKG